MARTYGIDFFSVLTRGSQYRVESLLVRLAHTQNYLMVSPTREQVRPCVPRPLRLRSSKPRERAILARSHCSLATTCALSQVGGQPALEVIPLVMEPESRLYCSPVVVLDFQSLYPSQVRLILALGSRTHSWGAGCTRARTSRPTTRAHTRPFGDAYNKGPALLAELGPSLLAGRRSSPTTFATARAWAASRTRAPPPPTSTPSPCSGSSSSSRGRGRSGTSRFSPPRACAWAW